jgi:hypothetical protein
MSRFKASLMFNSIGRLLVLTIMTTLTMSTVIFATSINGKLNESKNLTFGARNYTYAVKMYTPTTEGGQYMPMTDTTIGQSGAIDASQYKEGKFYMPGSYLSTTDSIEKINLSDSNAIINKYYYGTSITCIGKDNFKDNMNNDNGDEIGNLFMPLGDDMEGRNLDLFYQKNRILSKELMNYVIGVSVLGLGTQTNP